MTVFSVSSLLNQATAAVATHYHSAYNHATSATTGNDKTRPQRPAVLDISSLLNGDEKETTPTLSPARTPSPVSASSYPPPMLPSIADTWPAMLPPPAPAPYLPVPKAFAVESDNTDHRNSIWMHDSMASSVSSLASTLSSSSSSIDGSKTTLPLKKQQPRSSPFYDSSSEMSDHEHDPPISPDDGGANLPLKAKRRRANAKQLEVLNRVFARTVFPSTQLRAELGRQLGMSPRTVQIWFQNRRQAIRTRERQRLLRIVRDESATPDASSD